MTPPRRPRFTLAVRFIYSNLIQKKYFCFISSSTDLFILDNLLGLFSGHFWTLDCLRGKKLYQNIYTHTQPNDAMMIYFNITLAGACITCLELLK